MVEDTHNLDDWFHYASGASGFIGVTLKTDREKEFLTQEQQRAALGILGKKYDRVWLRLQSMPLPRGGQQFKTDLQRIVESVIAEAGIEVSINLEKLEELIQTGLE